MKSIRIPSGEDILVDDADFDYLSQFKWWKNVSGYIISRQTGKTHKTRKDFYLHRFLMNPLKGIEIDHINGNKLDNRRSNLRLVTHQQNIYNSRKQKNTSSKYIGVCWAKWAKLWRVGIRVNYKRINLGYFKTEEEAALAYDKAARKYHGEYAKLNELHPISSIVKL